MYGGTRNNIVSYEFQCLSLILSLFVKSISLKSLQACMLNAGEYIVLWCKGLGATVYMLNSIWFAIGGEEMFDLTYCGGWNGAKGRDLGCSGSTHRAPYTLKFTVPPLFAILWLIGCIGFNVHAYRHDISIQLNCNITLEQVETVYNTLGLIRCLLLQVPRLRSCRRQCSAIPYLRWVLSASPGEMAAA